MNKWISVKDELPEKTVLADQSGIIIKAFYLKQFEEECCCCEECDCEYSEENDAYYYQKGWYESVNNCYNLIKVFGGEITHWMPLPKPPENLLPKE